MNRVVITFALAAFVGTVDITAQQAQSSPATSTTATTTTTTAAAPAQPQKASDDVSLRLVYLIIAVIAGVIGLVLYFWKLMHWAVFTPLETEAGRERLRKIIEGAFKQNPTAFMELVHEKLDSKAGHQCITEYAIAHWATKDGRKQFLDMVIPLLRSDEADTEMMKLVAQYAEKWTQTQKEGQKSEKVGRDAADRPFFYPNFERDEMLRESLIKALQGDSQALTEYPRLFVILGSSLSKSEDRHPDRDLPPEEKKPPE